MEAHDYWEAQFQLLFFFPFKLKNALFLLFGLVFSSSFSSACCSAGLQMSGFLKVSFLPLPLYACAVLQLLGVVVVRVAELNSY